MKNKFILAIFIILFIVYAVFIKKYHIAYTYYEVVFYQEGEKENKKEDENVMKSRYEYYSANGFESGMEYEGFNKKDLSEINIIIYGRSGTLWKYFQIGDPTSVITNFIGKIVNKDSFTYSNISYADNLNKIYIFDNSNTDTNIKRGNAVYIDDLSNLQGLESLEYLDLSSKYVKINLNTISHFTNLTHLNISNSNISDIEPLINLKKIEVLDLSFNGSIDSLEPLYEMENLKELYIYRCDIEIEELIKLQEKLPNLNIYTNIYVRYRYPSNEPYWYNTDV